MNQRKRVIAGAMVEMTPKLNSTVRLNDILSHTKGAGTKAMQVICALADKHGVFLELTAIPMDDRMNLDQLVNWYEQFGFGVTNADDVDADMTRHPN